MDEIKAMVTKKLSLLEQQWEEKFANTLLPNKEGEKGQGLSAMVEMVKMSILKDPSFVAKSVAEFLDSLELGPIHKNSQRMAGRKS